MSRDRSLNLKKMGPHCEEVCLLLRALGHPGRLLVLGHLVQGEKSVSELQELCDLSQSQLSQFLIRMKSEGLLTSRREGQFQLYSIRDERVTELLLTFEKLFCS